MELALKEDSQNCSSKYVFFLTISYVFWSAHWVAQILEIPKLMAEWTDNFLAVHVLHVGVGHNILLEPQNPASPPFVLDS